MTLQRGRALTESMDTNRDIDSSATSTTQRAYEALRDAILTGEITPGEKLKVESLKASLNIGATPVREALSLLTSDQLVERRDQRGFRAATASKQQFEEILNLRCKLEELALRQSIERGDYTWERELVLAHHQMARHYDQPPLVWETHHKEFHMALISACDSPILLRFCDQLYSLNIRYRNFAGKSKSYGKRDVPGEHQEILQAATDRDAEKASHLLTLHYRTTGNFLANLLDLS